MLQVSDTAATHLICRYTVACDPATGVETVIFAPDSELRVYYDVAFGGQVVQASVSEDKNVDSRKASGGGRKSCAPAHLPNWRQLRQ